VFLIWIGIFAVASLVCGSIGESAFQGVGAAFLLARRLIA
jgi:hypothetical protein